MKKFAAAALAALFAGVSAPVFADNHAKKEEPKKAEAKKEEPKKDAPKKADAKKDEPAKKDERKKARGGC